MGAWRVRGGRQSTAATSALTTRAFSWEHLRCVRICTPARGPQEDGLGAAPALGCSRRRSRTLALSVALRLSRGPPECPTGFGGPSPAFVPFPSLFLPLRAFGPCDPGTDYGSRGWGFESSWPHCTTRYGGVEPKSARQSRALGPHGNNGGNNAVVTGWRRPTRDPRK